jgi:hypothetical protein
MIVATAAMNTPLRTRQLAFHVGSRIIFPEAWR